MYTFKSKQIDDFMIRDVTEADHEQLLALVTESMPSNGLILSFERQPSYFNASHIQYHTPETKVIVREDEPETIIAMINLGWKNCFIQGEVLPLRYISDLRLSPQYRGQKLLRLLMDFFYECFPEDTIYQSIILKENFHASTILHQKRQGFPIPYHFDDISTFTISSIKKPQNLDLQIQVLSEDKIVAVEQFIQTLSQDYNFLIDYNFKGLLEHQPFWRDLSLSDFYIAYQNDQIIGLYGLWDQSQIKQTVVKKYSRVLSIVKPLYNVYSTLTGGLILPQLNGKFDYLMTHSVLCKPTDTLVFHHLLFHAYQQMKSRSKQAFCITLSQSDPRIQVMKFVKAHKVNAVHTLHSFKAKPDTIFDRRKVSFIEVSRI